MYDFNDGDQYEFLRENKGAGKIFPGGPKCVHKGKEIPCLVAFTEGGGINSPILKEIF